MCDEYTYTYKQYNSTYIVQVYIQLCVYVCLRMYINLIFIFQYLYYTTELKSYHYRGVSTSQPLRPLPVPFLPTPEVKIDIIENIKNYSHPPDIKKQYGKCLYKVYQLDKIQSFFFYFEFTTFQCFSYIMSIYF